MQCRNFYVLKLAIRREDYLTANKTTDIINYCLDIYICFLSELGWKQRTEWEQNQSCFYDESIRTNGVLTNCWKNGKVLFIIHRYRIIGALSLVSTDVIPM